MKKWLRYHPALLILFLGLSNVQDCKAQVQELQQLLMNVEKLAQLKSILRDMQTGYQIYQQGYSNISGLSKGNFHLHSIYLNGLLAASPAVKNYGKVADILTRQADIVSEYKSAYGRFRQSGSFRPEELNYMANVYSGLVKEALEDMDALSNILAAGKLRMSDDERMRAIDRIYEHTSDKLQFLRRFNRQGLLLSIQRSKQANDNGTLKRIYGID